MLGFWRSLREIMERRRTTIDLGSRSRVERIRQEARSVEAVVLLTRPGRSWGDVEQRRCMCGAGLHWKSVAAQTEKKP
ncbi:hypothetical protein PVK06_007665 [Gossypium arboreum]|uniref:Uncharacterized protein n=1 Tax=Gossypium arboreum TaxID=29729 RepID=A0ABR0QI31_GOSAR|nr:hypothetical protein PVK06_007665 [Gossypium arboreum]